ncbi:hypothetical protein F4775DRAFT_545550 [Biscogniauxia sp. FL1348]|nr:hypothetical protein F4775DRAFT_545550 [Biscogniauxia sp. FL1348]
MEDFQRSIVEIKCEPKGLDNIGEIDPRWAYSNILLYPDSAYSETTFDYSVTNNTGHCRLAPVSLLKVIEIEIVRKKIVTDLFFVLENVGEEYKAVYERVGLVSVTFPRQGQMDNWVEEVFKSHLGPGVVITIV